MTPLQFKILLEIRDEFDDAVDARHINSHFLRMKETRSAIVGRKKVVRRITKKDLAREYLLDALRVRLESLGLNQCNKVLKEQLITIQKRRLCLLITGRKYTSAPETYILNLCEGDENRFHKKFTDLRELADFVIEFRDTHIFDKYDSMYNLKSFKRTAGELAYDDIVLDVSGDCCVCYDLTKSKTNCCRQHYCQECYISANDKCPMCRRKFPFLSNQLWYEHVVDGNEEE